MIAKTRPAVRLRPPPALDPPYEDEVALEAQGMQLTLQLDGGARRRPARLTLPPVPVPPRPAGAHGLTVAASAGGSAAGSRDRSTATGPVGVSIGARGPVPVADVAASARPAVSGASTAGAPVVPSVAATSPEARRAAKRFLDMCLEIFNGYRPAAHIRPLAGQLNAELIIEQVAAGLDRAERLRREREPVRVGRRTNLFVQPRRLRVCEPRAGVAEVAGGDRARRSHLGARLPARTAARPLALHRRPPDLSPPSSDRGVPQVVRAT